MDNIAPSTVSQHSVYSAMSLIASYDHTYGDYGISQTELKVLNQTKPFMAAHREQVKTLLERLVYGIQDLQGLSRFEPPVEYVVAIIMCVLKPINFRFGCAVLEGFKTSADIISGVKPQTIIYRGAHMFALIVRDYDNPTVFEFREEFRRKIGLAQQHDTALEDAKRAAKQAVAETR